LATVAAQVDKTAQSDQLRAALDKHHDETLSKVAVSAVDSEAA
jgi:hypothetical protein